MKRFFKTPSSSWFFILKGLVFMILAAILSYYGKTYKSKSKVVDFHGLVGWVFQQGNHLSSYIIFPHYDSTSVAKARGERFFLNPLDQPSLLDSNFIRYNQKDLYLLGRVFPIHVQRYCSYVDSGYTLFFQGNILWENNCIKSKALPNLTTSSPPLFESSIAPHTLRTEQNFFRLTVMYGSGFFHFTNDWTLLPTATDSASLTVLLDPPEIDLQMKSKIFVYPGTALVSTQFDSSLVLNNPRDALTLLWEKSGKLLMKKIRLRHPQSK